MKNFFKKNRYIRIVGLVSVMSLVFVQESQAKFFGSEETILGTQYAYGDTCVQLVEVKYYVFGIEVSSKIEQRPFNCNS
ncbi:MULTISPECIES: hypothetical protein [unclassified Arcicella]|uniref:hypothetical protein n=1 Tax=unclassified Arcicella TaxID=2644986 RepID=UPI00286117B0|nr:MULTISPECIES: hypothetical protein [unclassified Arcicella]MDR6562845.1 hypothetical protein [Arcicella sp. BE51]MDR6812814.1 hypothetical protein [Arcicella sp. BE140]MDR6824126.1 hypothetical protein [Arcicella sp. BE139]